MFAVILIVVVLFTAVCLIYLYRKREDRKLLARQCAYGNTSVYNVLVDSRDYKGLKALMGAANTFDERYFVSVSVSRIYPIKYLEQWVSAEPESADAFLCYGARLLQLSWDARGYGRGHEVTSERANNFFEMLDKTRDILGKCVQLSPDDPTPWSYLIMVATWSSAPHENRWEYFDQAVRRDPENWAAHIHMVVALSKKWSGDNEQMLEFGEWVAEKAKPGSDLAIVLIKAYIEYWKYLNVFEDLPIEAKNFIESEEIVKKATDAYHKSLGSPEHHDCACSIFARYNASSWFWITRNKPLLRNELNILDNRIEDIHWRWAGSEGYLKIAIEYAYSE